MIPPVYPPNPQNTPFMLWAGVLVEQLAGYNVPNPLAEDAWVTWATQFCSVPELAELGLPEPRSFTKWRDWAMSTMFVLT